MLKALSIKNVAVIEQVNIEFGEGFNILTGETGAGKSIIIDSLNMLKGERVSKTLIRNGEIKARVDGMFELSDETVRRIEEEFGIEADGGLLISREITADGKGSVRVNGAPMPLSMLKGIGELLINIHGQHDNTSLLSPKTHIRFLDSYAGEEAARLLEKYRELHSEYCRIERELEEIDTDERETARRAGLLKYQIDEIDMSSLTVGEDAELEARRNVLENAFKIASASAEAYCSLYDGGDYGTSAYDALWTAINAIEDIVQYDPGIEQAYNSLCDAGEAIKEAAHYIKNFSADADSSGSELDEIETRLEQIRTLKSKYSGTIEGILKKRDEFQRELDLINTGEERLEELKKQLERLGAERKEAAQALSGERKKCALGLNRAVMNSLAELNMPGVIFDTRFKEIPCRSDGADDVEFVICTNAGEGLKPLASIASGGELSRIMLAIKSILAGCDSTALLIFDEIDTGVSGAAAQKIGEKLWKMARGAQVVCITHLPQIAAMADSHYLIQKQTDGSRTRTSVALLGEEEHEREVARTLGGSEITEAALGNARELIRLADIFKANGG